MLDLRDFISGHIIITPSLQDSPLSSRLEAIRFTNLGSYTWNWIKNIIVGAFGGVCGNLIILSVMTGKQQGLLGYNAQYPYLQKALRRNIDDTIIVHDGIAPDPVIVMPSQGQSTVVISEGIIIYPSNAYILAPFVIHSDNALSDETRSRIAAEVNRLKFAGTRFTIDAPYPATSITE